MNTYLVYNDCPMLNMCLDFPIKCELCKWIDWQRDFVECSWFDNRKL